MPHEALGLPPVLTVDDLVELLNLDRKTIYAANQRGEIPGAFRIGNRIRFHRDALLDWMRQGRGVPED